MIDYYGYQNTTGIAGISVSVASLIFVVFFSLTRNMNTNESKDLP